MKLKIKIHKKIYSAHFVQGVPFNDEFNENLDSCAVIVTKVKKMLLEPYDDVLLFDEDTGFKKHLLVANYNAVMLNLTSGLFKYTIDLMSETKGLETVVLPNINFKQPLIFENKKTLYEIIALYLDTYSPKRKYDIGNHKWEYKNKYSLTTDSVFLQKTQAVVCPEFSLNAPTLRELMNFLFNVVDLLPIVKDGVVEFIDLSKPTNTFSFSNEENFITYSKSAENYSLKLVKDYGQGIGDNSHSNIVEYIGFRNIENATLKMDNLRVETSFPIYSINKIYMFLWKKVSAYKPNVSGAEYGEFPILVRFDITDFVVSSEYRNLLNPTYKYGTDATSIPYPDRTNDSTKEQSIINATKYQVMTLAFNRGQKNIDGWGYGWSYYDPEDNLGALGWAKTNKTFIENLINFLGYLYPYGQGRSSNDVQALLPDGWFINEEESTTPASVEDYLSQHVFTPIDTDVLSNVFINSLIPKLKTVLFKIDYQPVSSARVVIHKRHEMNEEYAITDNQSESLVDLKIDGDNAIFKAARFANELLQINGRYTDISHLLPLGAQNEDGYVIFKRSYSIYGNEIKANYAATKNYILKNYFTSIYAKKRNKTFMSIGESITRKDNNCLNIVLSKTKEYYDENVMNFYAPGVYSICSVLLSQFLKNQQQENKYYINSGLIKYGSDTFVQEINSFVVGNYAMCFDMEMQGNVSVGNYINEFWPATKLVKSDSIEAIGCLQKTYTVGDSETGFTDNIYFSIANVIDTLPWLRLDAQLPNNRTPLEQERDIKHFYERYLTLKPKYNTDWQHTSFEVSSQPIWKNNGEIINYNYQFDYSNTGEGIYLGKEFLLLNDMIRTKEKIFETYYDTLAPFKINLFNSVVDITVAGDFNQQSRPVIGINIPTDVVPYLREWDFGSSPLQINKVFVFNGTNSNKANAELVPNFKLSIKLIEIINYSNLQLQVRFEMIKTERNGNTITDNGVYTFKRFSTGAPNNNYLFHEIYDFDGFQTFGWAGFYESNPNVYATDMQNGNPKFLVYEMNAKSFETDQGYVLPNCYSSTFALISEIVLYANPHSQNCYIFFNKSVVDLNLDKRTDKFLTMNELLDLGFEVSNLKINEVFSIIEQPNGKCILKAFSPTSDNKMIAYFYKNSNDTYTLVFACELDNGLDSRIEVLSNTTTVSNIFNGEYRDMIFYPVDEEQTYFLNVVKPNVLTFLSEYGTSSKVRYGRFIFEAGKKYKFVLDSENSNFFDYTEDVEVWITSLTRDPSNPGYPLHTYTIPFTQINNKVDWVCPVSDTYIISVKYTVTHLPSGQNVDVPNIQLFFFDNTLELTDDEIAELQQNNSVNISKERTVYYQNIYISLLNNLNNRVYDSDGLMIGMNKNWAEYNEQENIDNTFEDLIDPNDDEGE